MTTAATILDVARKANVSSGTVSRVRRHGAMMAGAAGMLVGSALGSVIFGSAAVAAAYWLTGQIERTMREAGESRAPI